MIEENDRHFADHIFKLFLLNGNFHINSEPDWPGNGSHVTSNPT